MPMDRPPMSPARVAFLVMLTLVTALVVALLAAEALR